LRIKGGVAGGIAAIAGAATLPDGGAACSFTVAPPAARSASGSFYGDDNEDGTFQAGPEAGLAGWTVFRDANRNGAPDAGEASTVTDHQGRWRLDDLPLGRQRIARVPEPGWRLTTTGGFREITVVANEAQSELDWGYTQSARIDGTVYHDRRADGSASPGDQGLAARRVFADENLNGVLDEGEPAAWTNAAGHYALRGLASGPNWVRQVLPAGWAASGGFVARLVAAGRATLTPHIDLFSTTRAGVSGSIFLDADRDGHRDSEDPGLRKWRVFIDEDADGLLDAGERYSTTDAEGGWAFDDLHGGRDYAIRIARRGGGRRAVATPAGGLFTLLAGQTVSDLQWARSAA
jgi:hypothetical protein